MRLRKILPLLIIPIILNAPALPKAAAYFPGSMLFTKTWGTSGLEYGNAVALDAFQNIYVAGSMTNSTIIGVPPHDAALLLKYNSSGGLQWARSWGGLEPDEANAIAIDPTGIIYLTGATRSYNSGGTCQFDVGFNPCPDVFLLKYDPSGNLLMQKTWGGNNSDIGTGIALDTSGNIYLTGSTQSLPTCQSYSRAFLMKINSTGNLLWQQYSGHTAVNCSLANNVSGNGITVDGATGNIYVTTSLNGIGLELTKYNSTGAQIWQHELDGVGYSNGLCANPAGIALDPATHDILVTGEGGNCSKNLGDIHLIALRADSSGNLLWAKSWSSGLAYGEGIAVSPNGRIFVSGGQQTYGPKLGVVLLQLSATGDLLSHFIWGPTQGDIGRGVAVDSSGNAVVTGQLSGPSPYGQSVGNFTVATINANLSPRTLGLGTTAFPLNTPAGAASTPTGSEAYAGGTDAFLLKYKPPLFDDVACATFICTISSDSTISHLSFFSNRTLHFELSGAPGSEGYGEAIVPKNLFPNQDLSKITVHLNDTQLGGSSFTVAENSTDLFVYVPVTFHSVYDVYIFFPATPLSISPALPILTILAAVPIALRTRKRQP